MSRTGIPGVAFLVVALTATVPLAHDPNWQTHETLDLSIDTPTSWTASEPDSWGRLSLEAPDGGAKLFVAGYDQGKWSSAEKKLQSTSRGAVRRQINGITWKESRQPVDDVLQISLSTLHDGRLIEVIATYSKGYQTQVERVVDSLELPSPALRAVERLMRAYNAHDVGAMAQAVTDDIGWFSVEKESIGIEARGRASLLRGMASHFEAIPSARSEVESAEVSGRYVVVRERARWDGPDGNARTQSSLSIYEVRDGLVAAVWYFPAER